MGSKVIQRKHKELLARNAYVFGYSIVNRLEAIELRSCLKASQEHSLLSQHLLTMTKEMAELLQMCAVLNSALVAVVKRIRGKA